MAALLAMPGGARPIAIPCPGHVERFCEQPMLEREHWAERLPLEQLVGVDAWPAPG